MGCASSANAAPATVTMNPVFGERMVLQRRKPVHIFGRTSPGAPVTVTFNGQTKRAEADCDGKFSVYLAPMPAGGPFTLTVHGANTLKFNDVLVGEVFHVSGQSNMANTGANATGDDYPKVRQFYSNYFQGGTGVWTTAANGNGRSFSAVGYYFAREYHRALNIPVAILHTAVVAQPIKSFLDDKSKAENPEYRGDGATPVFATAIAPIVGYTIAAVAFNQGENDDGSVSSALYSKVLRSMVRNWRALWRDDFYFLNVQLPTEAGAYHGPQQGPGGFSRTAEIRQGQFEVLSLPRTALVTQIDVSDGDIHPVVAYPEVGKRLSLCARALVNGETIAYMGPTYDRKETQGNKLILHFLHVGSGFRTNQPIRNMAITAGSGADNDAWAWADVEVSGNKLILSSPNVQNPTHARYAWGNHFSGTPVPNLFSENGLPGPTFKTATTLRVAQ